MVSILLDDRLEPSGRIGARLDILVLTSSPDVLQDAYTVGHVRKDEVDRGVAHLGADLLGARAQPNQVLQKNLNHRVQAGTSSLGELLDEIASVC